MVNPFALTAASIFIGILAVLGLFLWLVQPVLIPLIIASSLCVLLAPLMDALSRRGTARATASLLMLLLLASLAALTIVLLLPPVMEIISSAPVVMSNISRIAADVAVLANDVAASYGLPSNVLALESERLQEEGMNLQSLSAYSGTVASALLGIVLVPVLCFFILRDYEGFRNACLRRLPNRYFELGCRLYFRVAEQLERYVRTVILQQSIMAFNATVGFVLAGLPHPILLGVLAGVCGLVPYLGPILALVAPALLILTLPDASLLLMGYAVAVILVIFLIDNVLVIPMLVAGSVNLHPLLVVVAVIIGGAVYGPIGMILSIPAVATLRMLLVELIISLKPLAKRQVQRSV